MTWLGMLKKVRPKAYKAVSEDRCPPDLNESWDVCPVNAPTLDEQCRLCWKRKIPEGYEEQAGKILAGYKSVKEDKNP